MDKKNILKSMINGGKAAAFGATHPVQAAYKGVQGARKLAKSSLGGMTTLGKSKPSIASMPTIKGGKGAYVSPNSSNTDNKMLVKKAIGKKK